MASIVWRDFVNLKQRDTFMNVLQLKKATGKSLQAARKKKFKSAKAFAEYLDINPSTYVEYEQGRTSFSVVQGIIFAQALDCSISDLTPCECQNKEQDQLEAYIRI